MDGIATIADVWVNGEHVLRSTNMFRSNRVEVELGHERNDIHIRCAALGPVLAQRRPRPRWKTYLIGHQNLRWVRTSLLGRIIGFAESPPVVGPWRPVRMRRLGDRVPADAVLRASVDGTVGTVAVQFFLPGVADAPGAQLRVGAEVAPMQATSEDSGVRLEGRIQLGDVERWWPHTHGAQPLYEVWADFDTDAHLLGSVGFRTLDVDGSDGGFRVVVNGEPVFCRGATWMPVDPVGFGLTPDVVDGCLDRMRVGNVNMLRIPGTTCYQDRHFFERCDQLGIMVWHDCMFAFCDPPDDDDFTREVVAEVDEALRTMAGHPCVTVICGNQEVEEIADGDAPTAVLRGPGRSGASPAAWRPVRDVESHRGRHAFPDERRREPVLRCRRVPPATRRSPAYGRPVRRRMPLLRHAARARNGRDRGRGRMAGRT
jgi:beta-mannosidase